MQGAQVQHLVLEAKPGDGRAVQPVELPHTKRAAVVCLTAQSERSLIGAPHARGGRGMAAAAISSIVPEVAAACRSAARKGVRGGRRDGSIALV